MSNLVSFFKSISYRNKVMLCYFLAVSIPYTIGIAYLYSSTVSSAKQSIIHTIDQRMNQNQIELNQKLKAVHRFAYNFSTNTTLNNYCIPDFYDEDELISATNDQVKPIISWMQASSGTSSSFHFLTSADNVPESETFVHLTPYKNSQWVKNIRNQINDRGYYFEPLHESRAYLYSKPTEEEVFSIICKMSGAPESYLEMDISLDYLFKEMMGTSVSRTGQVLFLPDNTHSAILARKNGSEIFRQPFSKIHNKKDTNNYILINKKKFYYTSRYIPNLNGKLIALIPSNQISQPTRKALLIFVLIVILITLFVVLISYIISTLLLTRINRMDKVVAEIQEGNFDVSIPVNGNDEIDELASSINDMSTKIKELIENVYKVEVEKKDAELMALQTQINPHFLFNILETFRMLAELEETDGLAEGLEALGNLMRYNLSDAKTLVPLSKELHIIQHYICIQNLLHNGRISLTIDIENETVKRTVPSFILQPIIENSINHGLTNDREPLKIKISEKKNSAEIFIQISDNGQGAAPDVLKQLKFRLKQPDVPTGTSIGLRNVDRRLKMTFGEKNGLMVQSTIGEGFTTSFQLPENGKTTVINHV